MNKAKEKVIDKKAMQAAKDACDSYFDGRTYLNPDWSFRDFIEPPQDDVSNAIDADFIEIFRAIVAEYDKQKSNKDEAIREFKRVNDKDVFLLWASEGLRMETNDYNYRSELNEFIKHHKSTSFSGLLRKILSIK